MYRSKLDRWTKIQNVTPSHSLLGQLYGPKRDQKLFKYSNKVPKLLKNSKNRECDDVTFLIGSTLWPKIQNVTPSHSLLGQLFGPEYMLQTAWLRQKMAFFQMPWRDAAIGLIYSGSIRPIWRASEAEFTDFAVRNLCNAIQLCQSTSLAPRWAWNTTSIKYNIYWILQSKSHSCHIRTITCLKQSSLNSQWETSAMPFNRCKSTSLVPHCASVHIKYNLHRI